MSPANLGCRHQVWHATFYHPFPVSPRHPAGPTYPRLYEATACTSVIRAGSAWWKAYEQSWMPLQAQTDKAEVDTKSLGPRVEIGHLRCGCRLREVDWGGGQQRARRLRKESRAESCAVMTAPATPAVSQATVPMRPPWLHLASGWAKTELMQAPAACMVSFYCPTRIEIEEGARGCTWTCKPMGVLGLTQTWSALTPGVSGEECPLGLIGSVRRCNWKRSMGSGAPRLTPGRGAGDNHRPSLPERTRGVGDNCPPCMNPEGSGGAIERVASRLSCCELFRSSPDTAVVRTI